MSLYFTVFFSKVHKIRKPMRAVRFSVKYNIRFQDRSFNLKLLFDFKLLLEVELIFHLDLLLEAELLISCRDAIRSRMTIWYGISLEVKLIIWSRIIIKVEFVLVSTCLGGWFRINCPSAFLKILKLSV